MYSFYLDGVLLPVAPSKLTRKINNQNKTINLINDGEVNILKTPGLTDVSFDALIPEIKYPFAVYVDGFKPAEFYTDKFEKLKTGQKPFQFKVIRSTPGGRLLFDIDMTVSMEEYTIEEAAENGFDLNVSIQLKQYREYKTKKVEISQSSQEQEKKVLTTVNTRPVTKEPPKTYTVQSGETLWAICKKQLGDGTKYQEIAKLNGIPNPNLIKTGQVIRFG